MEEKFDIKGLDDEEENPSVDLLCRDEIKVACSRSSAMLSDLIKSTLEGDAEATEVVLYHIDSPIVLRVIEYMDYHQKVPPREIKVPLKSNMMRDIVDSFDANFVDSLDQTTLFQLLLAANYMAVNSLVTLLCAKIASMMKGKTPSSIRKAFGIRDFTPDEKEEVKKAFPNLVE